MCVIDIFSKYTWVVPLKDKKGITITNALQKKFKEPNRKQNKIWVDKRSEFYNSSVNFFFFFNMNIVLTNKYNKKLQSPGAVNIKETPGYKRKDNSKNK